MSYFDIVLRTNESTVVTEYKSTAKQVGAYESEAALEDKFIKTLQEQCYERLYINSESELIDNLRVQIEKLNDYTFSDSEWKSFFSTCIAGANDGIKEKSRRIQEDNIQVLRRDNGESKNISLIDKKNIHHNSVQVINQYVNNDGKHDNRYDVTVLVNGLPLVHIELKRRGVPLRQAFNQIERYQKESFWAASGLYDYVQIFVISNGTRTKYYSNTTRFSHIKELGGHSQGSKTSHSYEFTSYWADAANTPIYDLEDFAKTFFCKRTLLNILTKYCVFTSDQMLMVMRPYQIVATERIINRIEIASNYKKWGSVAGGGYIWHTTGSGKTLTSFKTAQIASKIEGIDKVLFVVDRKDLDYQTMREYEHFEKGAANSNRSTAVLKRQLEDGTKSKIIITTIQKLATFISKNPKHDIYQSHVVIIFDECHRSQFGEMHQAIVKHFKKYHIFGFTGTPIFPENSTGSSLSAPTTEQAFGDRLHSYTIIDAIRDNNVLPFKVDYIKTMDTDDAIDDEKVNDIDREKAFMAPERIRKITEYIFENFNRKTYRKDYTYTHNIISNVSEVAASKSRKVSEEKRQSAVVGFNSIFAVASIDMARLYYKEFKRQNELLPQEKRLKFATIFSYGINEGEFESLAEENPEDTDNLDTTQREFLDSAIDDYNTMFHCNYSTASDGFQSYYKDVAMRMKNREIDILIVVNMFLTGFDATTLNTLWVDKNLKTHGLLQAFSRTNRILNSVKKFGNIVCFRNLQKKTEEAISLFGDKEAKGLILLKTFDDYYYGFTDDKHRQHPGYETLINELQEKFPISHEPDSEQDKKDFLVLFGNILRYENLLNAFDEFKGNEILSELEMQNYRGRYLDIKEWWKAMHPANIKTDISDDIVFQIELIRQVEINIDYILALVEKYKAGHKGDVEILLKVKAALSASPDLRSKKELILDFIDSLNNEDDIMTSWTKYVENEKMAELNMIIEDEHLKREETLQFIEDAFIDGAIKTIGTDIDEILPPMSRFDKKRAEKKEAVIQKLLIFFEKYYGIA